MAGMMYGYETTDHANHATVEYIQEPLSRCPAALALSPSRPYGGVVVVTATGINSFLVLW